MQFVLAWVASTTGLPGGFGHFVEASIATHKLREMGVTMMLYAYM